MSNQNWWVRPARSEEQGSFCDRNSDVHYDNVSDSEAEDEREAAMRRGDGVIEVVRYDCANDRFNTNLTETDAQGYDHPSKQRPGK